MGFIKFILEDTLTDVLYVSNTLPGDRVDGPAVSPNADLEYSLEESFGGFMAWYTVNALVH